jgi:hypothetical protein
MGGQAAATQHARLVGHAHKGGDARVLQLQKREHAACVRVAHALSALICRLR